MRAGMCLASTRWIYAAPRAPMPSSSATSASESCSAAPAMFSRRWVTDEVPGISRMFGERWSSQARATAMGAAVETVRHGVQGVGLQRGEAAEGEVGHVGDALGGKAVDQVVVATIGNVVEVLDADDRRDRPSLGDLFG